MNDRRVEISRHVPTDATFVFVTWFLTYAMTLSKKEDFRLSLGGIALVALRLYVTEAWHDDGIHTGR